MLLLLNASGLRRTPAAFESRLLLVWFVLSSDLQESLSEDEHADMSELYSSSR
jgi:hypothetical protein